MLSCEINSSSSRVPGSNSKTITAALEVVRPAISDDPFEEALKDGLDSQDQVLTTMLEVPPILPSDPALVPSDPLNEEFHATFEDISVCHQSHEPSTETGALPSTGDPAEMFWELDNQYYERTASCVSRTGQYTIK